MTRRISAPLWGTLLLLAATASLGGDGAPFLDSYDGFCVSKDGKRLAVGCWSVWDVAARKRLLKGRTHGAHGIALSPDGKYLAVVGNYSEFFVYDARTGKEHWNLTLKGHGDTVLMHAAFAADGNLLTASANGILRVWDVERKEATALFSFPSPLEFDQNRQDECLRAWRAGRGDGPPDGVKTFVKFDHKIRNFRQFAVSPDGKTVAVPTNTSKVLLIDLATGKVLEIFKTEQESALTVAYSPDGKRLAVGGGSGRRDWKGTIEVWDVGAGLCHKRFKAHAQSVLNMAFSPDGKSLASGGLNDGACVWDVASGRQRYALHQNDPNAPPRGDLDPVDFTRDVRVTGVAFLPDGKTLLTQPHGSGNPVHFWDAATGKRIPQPPK